MTSKDTKSFSLEDIRLFVPVLLPLSLHHPYITVSSFSHGNIEHDASISRNDVFNGGDNYSFNNTLYEALSDQFPDVDYYNVTAAGLAMKRRLKESQELNPLNNTNTQKEVGARSGESALYLSAMGDVNTGVAPKKSVMLRLFC